MKPSKAFTLELNEGEIVTVLGANGAGKSTLLKAVSRLIPPEKGQMRFAGRAFGRLAAFEVVRMGISHCPEGRKVFATLTVDENLNLGAYTRRRQKADLKQEKERVFDLFPILRQRRRQLSGTLSGGEQQMLAMGRALMSRPKILLLDEPSLGLAPLLVRQIFKIIREINAQGGFDPAGGAKRAQGAVHRQKGIRAGNRRNLRQRAGGSTEKRRPRPGGLSGRRGA